MATELLDVEALDEQLARLYSLLDYRLQDRPVEYKIRKQALQAAVLTPKLPKFVQFLNTHPGILLSPV